VNPVVGIFFLSALWHDSSVEGFIIIAALKIRLGLGNNDQKPMRADLQSRDRVRAAWICCG
jgi:hypothetical protein